MRISTLKNDPGYSTKVPPCKVFLNGAEVKDCVMADEELGEVMVAARDANGFIKLVGKDAQHETLRGCVAIDLLAADRRVVEADQRAQSFMRVLSPAAVLNAMQLPESRERELLAHLLKKYEPKPVGAQVQVGPEVLVCALFGADAAHKLNFTGVSYDVARDMVLVGLYGPGLPKEGEVKAIVTRAADGKQTAEFVSALQASTPAHVSVGMASGPDETAFATGGMLSPEAGRRMVGDGGIAASALGPIAAGAAALLRLPVKDTMKPDPDAAAGWPVVRVGDDDFTPMPAVEGGEVFTAGALHIGSSFLVGDTGPDLCWPFGGSKPVTLLPEEADQPGHPVGGQPKPMALGVVGDLPPKAKGFTYQPGPPGNQPLPANANLLKVR